MELIGRVALVTGGATGIGRATVLITEHPGKGGIGPEKNDNTKITRDSEVRKP